MIENPMELTAPVSNIQSFSIHDGPGIRVTVFLKGCPLRCVWCANPETNSALPQLMTYSSKCTGCGSCLKLCPEGAIELIQKDGRQKEFTDRSICVNCGACVPVCAAGAREIVGEEMSVDRVLARVLEDRLFMEESGGGLTLSGGECLAHPDFAEALLREAQRVGIHTAVESCVYASESLVDRVFSHVDLALLDIKHMDSARHKELTGVGNERILQNILHIYQELKVPVIIRVPCIPGCNDDHGNIAATARFIRERMGTDVEVHLLPYHRMGEGKSESLGQQPLFSAKVPENKDMEELSRLVASYGLKVQIGG